MRTAGNGSRPTRDPSASPRGVGSRDTSLPKLGWCPPDSFYSRPSSQAQPVLPLSPEVIPMPTHAETKERPIESLSREERVRRRAEVVYRLRGNRPGSAMDDWLLAEEQIRREIEEQAVDEASEDSFPASDPPAHFRRAAAR